MDPYVSRDNRQKLWLRMMHMHLPVTALPQPIVSHLRTNDTSRTTQDAVEDANLGLDALYRGRAIWERAWAYISPRPFNSDPAVDPPNPLRVWDSPNALEEAPPMYRRVVVIDFKDALDVQ